MAIICIDTEVDIDPEDYMDAISTEALKVELAKRKGEPAGPLTDPPSHIISDLKRAFESKNPHEFYYLVRKVEMLLEAVDG